MNIQEFDMMLNQSFSFKEQMNQKGVLLCYEGDISQKIIEDIGRIIKHNIEVNANPILMRRLFGIFIEQAQNILHYSTDEKFDEYDNEDLKKAVAILGKNGNDKYYMITGNLVTKSQQKNLSLLLEEIKKLSRKELMDLYVRKVKTGSIVKGKGGGVGLLEIARFASEPLEYTINDIDDNFSYFIMKAVIKGRN